MEGEGCLGEKGVCGEVGGGGGREGRAERGAYKMPDD